MKTDLLSQSSFQCDADMLGVSLVLSIPRGLGQLITRMLSGWTVTELVVPSKKADIRVDGHENYHLTSRHYNSGKRYDDIVSILNEVLVAIAYTCRDKLLNTSLIHAAGFRDGKTEEAIFGARKTGKSVLIARKAASGHRIYADDLLLWRVPKHQFVGLGLSPRLRRPVLPDLLDQLPESALIVGQYTCYIDAAAIDLAPAGSILQPDRVSELQADRTLRKVPIFKIKTAIAAHTIQ